MEASSSGSNTIFPLQTFCDHCRNLSLATLRPHLSGPARSPKDPQPTSGYRLFDSSHELRVSAQTCSLCTLIEASLLLELRPRPDVTSNENLAPLGLETREIMIEPKKDTLGKAFPYDLAEGLYINALVIRTTQLSQPVKTLRGKVRLYVDEGCESLTT